MRPGWPAVLGSGRRDVGDRVPVLPAALHRLECRHRAWRYRTRVDPAEIDWLRTTLRPGDTTVDAGAYKGGYTYWMRHAVGAGGRVLAFEPQPALATYLERSTDVFDWDNVTVHRMALSSSSGELALHVPGKGPSQRGSLVVQREGADTYSVPVDTLDDVLGTVCPDRRIALIKCDVEGSELDFFLGAHRTLTSQSPRLLFECEARFQEPGHVERVFDLLHRLGYEGRFFWMNELRSVSDFDAKVHQAKGGPCFANNFVFERPRLR